jgi:hypothetical protein
MTRMRIIFVLGLAVLALTLALPAVARADDSSSSAPTALTAGPSPDGWTWDESAAPSPDGWTWDE